MGYNYIFKDMCMRMYTVLSYANIYNVCFPPIISVMAAIQINITGTVETGLLSVCAYIYPHSKTTDDRVLFSVRLCTG